MSHPLNRRVAAPLSAATQTNGDPITVLKFGGSVLRDEHDLSRGVHEIYRWLRLGRRVVAVVSAFEGTTDALLSRANAISQTGCTDARTMLLATGELTTASLLALALDRAGIPAGVLGPHSLGLRTKGSGADADPASIDLATLRAALDAVRVIVVPGFVGVGDRQQLTLLGRGGSDLTALFIASELGNTHCRLIKDVDGLYDRDPAIASSTPARRYRSLSWDGALALDGGIVQHKAVRLCRERGLAFEVGSFNREDVSSVGDHATTWYGSAKTSPLRVAVLGGGVVGRGVVEHLLATPETFEVTGVLVRDPSKHTDFPVLVTTNPDQALRNAQIVVEVIGGTTTAGDLIERALGQGAHVVTANKALIAARGESLEAIAASNHTTLRYSAAVGGVVPMIETVLAARDAGGVTSFEGVINGTTNFVLDRLAAGATFDAAVDEAKRLGYAEADPTRDLDGSDAFDKLVLLARAAFGSRTRIDHFTKRGLLGSELSGLLARRTGSQRLRLVGWARQTPGGVEGGVGPCIVSESHPLHLVPGVSNRIAITDRAGRVHVRDGAGAGRWPTSEAVFADLLDTARLIGSRDREAPRSASHDRHAEPACLSNVPNVTYLSSANTATAEVAHGA